MAASSGGPSAGASSLDEVTYPQWAKRSKGKAGRCQGHQEAERGLGPPGGVLALVLWGLLLASLRFQGSFLSKCSWLENLAGQGSCPAPTNTAATPWALTTTFSSSSIPAGARVHPQATVPAGRESPTSRLAVGEAMRLCRGIASKHQPCKTGVLRGSRRPVCLPEVPPAPKPLSSQHSSLACGSVGRLPEEGPGSYRAVGTHQAGTWRLGLPSTKGPGQL